VYRRLVPLSLIAVGAVGATVAAAPPFPESITLTSDATADLGFQAEGIVARGATAYAGSLATGTIVEIDLRTGEVQTLIESADGPAVGLELVDDVLYVAGGPSGQVRAYDANTGEELAVVSIDGAGFINDLAVTSDAVYATDSFSDVLYRLPLDDEGVPGEAEALTLTGDFQLAGGFNANGIVTVDDDRLVIAQSTDPVDDDGDGQGDGSALYLVTIDGDTAVTHRIELDGDVSNADGLLLRGRTLYVVENQQNSVAVVRLAGDLTSGEVVERLTDDDTAVPTTATFALGGLYAVNANFGAVDPTQVDYEVIRIDLR
jgi:hypothetical protein